MTDYIFSNNVNTTLAASVVTTDTSISLSSSANLPTLSAGQMMPITLNDAATGLIFEIMYVTAITGTTLTVTRAQEGTSAQNWAAGDYAFCAMTAGTTAPINGLPTETFEASNLPYVVSDKTALQSLDPTRTSTAIVLSSDGGRFNSITGAPSTTYSDNGGSYCGTITIPTGGDGSSAWLRDFSGEFNVEWFGAFGKGIVLNDEVGINLAFDAASVYSASLPPGYTYGGTVYIPTGTYKTSAPIVAKTQYYGDSVGTQIRPQGAFEAIEVQPMWLADIRDYMIDYTDAGPTVITSACHGHYLLKGSTTAGEQLAHVKFSGIIVQRGYDAFYHSPTDAGQFWMVEFERIDAAYCKDWGWNLDLTGTASGSLMISFVNCVVECPNGLDTWSGWTTGKGYHVTNSARVSFHDSTVARPQATSGGATGIGGTALYLSSITAGCDIKGITIESATLDSNYTDDSLNSVVALLQVPDVTADVTFVTPTINPGAGNTASYIYIDGGVSNFNSHKLNEYSPTITSGSRKLFNVNSASTIFAGQILDPKALRSDCVFATADPDGQGLKLASDTYALSSNPRTRRRFNQVTTTASVATTIMDETHFYGSTAYYPSALLMVQGVKTTDGTVGFTDLIMIAAAGTSQSVTIINSTDVGAVDARAYTLSSGLVQVTINNNTYNLSITGIDQMNGLF